MTSPSETWLWWRHAWFFNWAHKPLCEAYREDVLRIGRLRLCRGCTLLWAGALIGGPVILAATPVAQWTAGFWAALAIVAGLSYPGWYSSWPRPLRDLLRFAAGALPVLTLGLLSNVGWLPGLLASAALGLTYGLFRGLRQGRRLHKCETCPEFGEGVCSGYSTQAQAIRAWEEDAAQREMRRRGYS